MKTLLVSVLASISLLNGCASIATPPKPLEVIVFPGGFNWPIWVAQEKGFFDANGVSVNVTPTPSSEFQLTNLIDGKFDIAMTAVDNLVAYREGQGEAPKIGGDLVAVMGADRGFLKLVTVPQVKSMSDLRGKVISVDARNTGYALVLFELLDRANLREPDISIERAGGVLQRYQALLEQKHAGTMLISPFEVQAQRQGFNVLATASEAFGSYQGLVAGVRKSWATHNSAQLQGYIKGYAQGVEWLYEPKNREVALSILENRVPNTTRQSAEAAYKILLDEKTGMQRKAAIDIEGVRQVLALRSKWGQPKRELSDPYKYYDATYYDAAMTR